MAPETSNPGQPPPSCCTTEWWRGYHFAQRDLRDLLAKVPEQHKLGVVMAFLYEPGTDDAPPF